MFKHYNLGNNIQIRLFRTEVTHVRKVRNGRHAPVIRMLLPNYRTTWCWFYNYITVHVINIMVDSCGTVVRRFGSVVNHLTAELGICTGSSQDTLHCKWSRVSVLYTGTLQNLVDIFFWFSGIIDCTLFIFENVVPLMR